MREHAVRIFAALALVAAVSAAQAASTSGTLVTSKGAQKISVEVADTPKEREVGLMNRPAMPADAGMLFDFGETRPVTMWMKNTLIPLDMVFMNDKGIVTHVKTGAQPQSLDLISSGGPVRYVLELNGGAAARYGVRAGDPFRHPIVPKSAQ